MVNSSKKIVKFGGSSLSCAEKIMKACDIIRSDPSRQYVVPSAPGKRFADDIKITDMLILCHKLSHYDDFHGALDDIKERYDEIIRGLGIELSLENEFKIIGEALENGTTYDYVASRGEYLNGIILAKYLGFNFVDPAEIILFDEKGVFDSEKTNEVAGKRLNSLDNAVIPGFYGSMPDGSIKTFSRDGSDVSGAIVARAIMADVYENWTDVSGFSVCDPRIVDNPKVINTITYRELRELSYMGASVLHEDSIFPVKVAGIPINIKNTNAPNDPGTLIVPTAGDARSENVITGIAGKKGFAILNIVKDMMNQEIGFGMRVLQVLANLGMSFEHFPSGIDTMCVIISENAIAGKEKLLLSELSKAVNPDHLSIETGLALIAVVGRGMVRFPGTASRVFSSIAKRGINIRMIDQGSSELNIIIGIEEGSFNEAINAIYDEFYRK